MTQACEHALGAIWKGGAVDFALFSAHATGVELCLLDAAGVETRRVPLHPGDGGQWHARLSELAAGQLYAYRVDGPAQPEVGHRFDPSRLLLDPYAKAIRPPATVDGPLLSVVVDPAWDWDDDSRPEVPWRDTVVYECQVKGLTARHPEVPESLRGTYLGLACEPVLDHLRSLSVTTVELMPVHQCISEPALVERGLTNYWGYNSIGFFAPDARFASGAVGQQVAEFKAMVQALHRAGLEVVLDVVFNHTGEGGLDGPTVCFRGIDNATYYRRRGDDPGAYDDLTGCGNTLDTEQPMVLQLVLDSLRYWVEEMHVDGFRFDLAPALARQGGVFDPAGAFFAAVAGAPELAGVKLIAEPWDLGPGGYQLGAFPAGWVEWNGRYRDGVRQFWRGDRGRLPDLAARLAGSRDLFVGSEGRQPASINYLTCHDGFTLVDLVSYEGKHNGDNPHDNRDGTDDNFSCNWGVEGDTDDRAVRAVRDRVRRDLIATLAFSRGVPMLSGGDELGRSQRGNNNAYCHDDERSWTDWSLDADGEAWLGFVRDVFAVRRTLVEWLEDASLDVVASGRWRAVGGGLGRRSGNGARHAGPRAATGRASAAGRRRVGPGQRRC